MIRHTPRFLRNALCFLGVAAALCFTAAQVTAQEGAPEPAPENEELVVRVYRVSDLVMPRPDRPYLGLQLPGRGRSSDLLGGGLGGIGGIGGGGGGFGGGGAGGGGGFFAVPDDVLGQIGGGGGVVDGAMGSGMGGTVNDGTLGGNSTAAITISELMRAITAVVAPDSWSEVGGAGVIVPLRGMLIVSQTQTLHAEIEKLLDALREEGGVLRDVTIRAWWLPLNDDQLAELTEPGAAGRTVSPQALAELAAAATGYKGEVTCFDNQVVHIISGEVRTLVQGATPVVGGSGEVGYQPIVERLHTGALLEIRPSLVPGADVVVADLSSFVTEWRKPEPPTDLPSGPIDRPQFVAHQLTTTVRAPLGKPIIVGGLTLSQPTATDDASADPLYLILEVTVNDAEPGESVSRCVWHRCAFR